MHRQRETSNAKLANMSRNVDKVIELRNPPAPFDVSVKELTLKLKTVKTQLIQMTAENLELSI